MIIDENSKFFWKKALTNTGTYVSDNVLDTSRGDVSALGCPLYAVIQVHDAIASGGAATVQFQLIQADSSDLNTNPQVVYDSGAVPKAQLGAGALVAAFRMPVGVPSRKYLGAKVTVGGAALTGGTFSVFLTPDASFNYGVFKK